MNIEETSLKIEDMTIRGAGRIARSASKALKQYAEGYEGSSLDDFLEGLEKGADRLLSTRPTAVSLFNGVQMTLRGVGEQGDLQSAGNLVLENSDAFCQLSESAYGEMASYAPDLVPEEGRMAITICNSAAAISVLIAAYRAGKITGVYACETRPKRQGLITILELSEAGVPVTLIVDSAMMHVMPRVSVAFIGTDTLESDGSVINKIGTLPLAIAAREHGVPVYACAETFKFMPPSKAGQRVEIEQRPLSEIIPPEQVPPGAEVFNPVFDRVPPELVTGIITEVGVFKPSQAPRLIEEYLEGI